MNSEQLRAEVTNQIVQALESGNLPPWRKPFQTVNDGPHRNLLTRKPYTGVNPLILEMASQRHGGFTSSIWATFNQWKQMGGQVKRRPDHVPAGKWGTQIVYSAPITKKKRSGEDEEETKFFLLKSYTVFCLDQVDGPFDHLRPQQPEPSKLFENFEAGDELIAATGADIRTGNLACYVPSGDYIIMPSKESFHSAPEYYETAFHELTHWTEHSSRLNWDRKNESYAMGELIADVSACYLAAELGIPNPERIEQSSAYLKGWLECLKGDNRAIFRACSQASKANDFLLKFVRTPEPVEATA